VNRAPRLSRSGIEYIDFSWGIFSGCRNLELGICPVKACWAKGISLHYPKLYPDGFEPHYYPEAINSPLHLKKPSRIAVGWVGDIIGYGLEYRDEIFDTILNCPQHTFLFLTKNPENLTNWGDFPPNCDVGVTATNTRMIIKAGKTLEGIVARVKYISIEPFFEWQHGNTEFIATMLQKWGINWLIIGAQTRPTVMPKIEWVREIVEAADKAGVKVFLKENLRSLFTDWTLPEWAMFGRQRNKEHPLHFRQEMPQ